MANGVLFGSKEQFMMPLNEFLTANTSLVKEFLCDLAVRRGEREERGERREKREERRGERKRGRKEEHRGERKERGERRCLSKSCSLLTSLVKEFF
jgi:hypothetical protein